MRLGGSCNMRLQLNDGLTWFWVSKNILAASEQLSPVLNRLDPLKRNELTPYFTRFTLWQESQFLRSLSHSALLSLYDELSFYPCSDSVRLSSRSKKRERGKKNSYCYVLFTTFFLFLEAFNISQSSRPLIHQPHPPTLSPLVCTYRR